MSWWPFGKKDSGTDLSPDVKKVFEKISRFLDDEAAQNSLLPENFRHVLMQNPPCDQVASGFGEFGRTLTNPVPVNGPVGELLYLSQLEKNGIAVAFHRLGAHDNVDIFEVLSEDGRSWDLLYLSFYYPRKSRAMPAGYRKMADRGRGALVRGTTRRVDGFPKGIYGAAIECTKGIFGMSIADPRLKSFEQSDIARSEKHLAALRQLKFSSQTPAPRTGADPLDSRAENLVSSCSILATASFVPLIDQFTFLQKCKPEDWDFFAAAVAVNVALNNLATEVAPERFKRLDSMIAAKLGEWDRQGLAAVRDCQQFVNRAVTKGNNETQQAVHALGLWLLWNLLGHQPTLEESRAASAIGTMLSTPLQDWWHPKRDG